LWGPLIKEESGMAKRQRRRRRERRRRHAEQHGWSTSRSVITGAGLTAGAVLGMGGVAHATDFTVTNLGDGAAPYPAGSLRKAISDANANPGADQIVFDASLSGRVLLSQASIPITDALTISGPGADQLTVDAYYGLGRIFTINPTTAGDPVTISGLTLAYGHPAGSGGAIFNFDAKLTVADSWLYGNASGSLATGVAGGAIEDNGDFSNGTQTRIENSTISGNSAPEGYGGGVAGALRIGTIINSTIAGNYAYRDGGGFFSNDDGGVFQNSTIAGNYAYDSGGGIANGTGGAHTALMNSIVADNDAGDGSPDLLGSNPFDTEFSLVENTTGVTLNSTVTGSNLTGDPGLPNYLDYSGSTPTIVPDYTSPVIDQGKAEGGVSTDQRGFTRPLDLDDSDFPDSAATGADASDIGAVEDTVNETTPADLSLGIVDSPDPVTVGDPLNYAFTVTNDGPNPATGVSMSAFIPSALSLNTSSLSGNCHVTATVPDYGIYLGCDFAGIGSGASKVEHATVTPLAAATSVPYVSIYAYASGDQVDPNTYGNFAYADTVVRNLPSAPPPAVTPPPSSNAGVAAAIKRCKKKFHGKRRKKCIKRAKGHASAAVQRRWRKEPTVHPWTKRDMPRGIEAPATRSRLDRLSDR
jgi:uncharacterized repeat protein (TIGR01451 family)